MNRIFKINTGVLGLAIAFYLTKQNYVLSLISAILLIYTSFYLILKGIEEDFNLKYYYFDKIYLIFLGYYFQKERLVFYKNIERDKLLLGVNILVVLIILLFTYCKNKKISKIEINLVDFNKWIVLLFPLFIIRGKGFGIGIFYCLLILYKILKNKKVDIPKGATSIIISILFLISWVYFSSIINILGEFGKDTAKNLIEVLFIFILFLFIDKKNISIKEILYVFIGASLLKVLPAVVDWVINGQFDLRAFGDTHPTIFGSEMGLMAVLFFYIIVYYKKYGYSIFYIFFLLGIYSSGSRGPLLITLFLNSFTYIWLNRDSLKKILIFLSIICLILIGILKTNNRLSETFYKITRESKLDNSSLERIYIYKEAWRQFSEKPFLGNGFNNYREIAIEENKGKFGKISWQELSAYNVFHAHNNVLQILSSLGIIGLVIYLSYLFFILKGLKKSENIFLGVLLVSYFELNGIVDYTLYFYKTQKILFFILSILLIYGLDKANKNKDRKS